MERSLTAMLLSSLGVSKEDGSLVCSVVFLDDFSDDLQELLSKLSKLADSFRSATFFDDTPKLISDDTFFSDASVSLSEAADADCLILFSFSKKYCRSLALS